MSGAGGRVSVVLPTFERAGLVGDALASVLGQTVAPHEVIVIDDGSQDDTEAAVARFGGRVRYVRRPHRGKAAALNHGMALASGDLILAMDDDDLLPPGAIAAHCAALRANPAADFSYGRFTRFDGDPASAPGSRDVEPVPAGDRRRLVVQLLERCFLTNPTWMARADALTRAGPYRETLARSQDFDMLLRLARANEGVAVDEVVLWQRRHVAARGPASEKVTAAATVDLWIKYNEVMACALDEEWGDADFRPHAGAATQRLAVLQRATAMFLHRAYDRAGRHLDRYLAQLGDGAPEAEELFAASYLLGSAHGIDDLLVGRSEGERMLRGRRLPLALRIAFARQLRWRLLDAAAHRDGHRAAALARFGLRALGPAAMALLPLQPRSRRRRTRLFDGGER